MRTVKIPLSVSEMRSILDPMQRGEEVAVCFVRGEVSMRVLLHGNDLGNGFPEKALAVLEKAEADV